MKWIAKDQPDAEKVKTLVDALGAPKVVAELLCQRGIDEPEKVKEFFNPRIADLHDPFLMQDMEQAMLRIDQALDNEEALMIYGDYDVDGTTAVALVYSFFRPYFKQIEYYIPDREKEGYGISKKGIDHAHSVGITLIIALDCGVRSVELVAYAKDLGIDFIICDHHLPGNILPPSAALLDPKRSDCEYPFKELSGCGIGFKLAEAFAQVKGLDPQSYLQYLDLLVLSIAADIVPIVGENRILAHFGLKVVNAQPSVGIRTLASLAINKETIGIGDLVFYIAPRINAAGRMGHAKHAVELLISDNEHEALPIAERLHESNNDRKDQDKMIIDQIKMMVAAKPELLESKTLVFHHPDWHKGVVGIAASRVIELYHRPTIILTTSNGKLTGSARSISGFDVHEALVKCAVHLKQFGGHMYAAGLTMDPAALPAFTTAFEAVGQEQLTKEDLEPKLYYDSELPIDRVDKKLLNIIDRMGPFGPSNRTPVFMAKGLHDNGSGRIIGKTMEHIKLRILQPTGQVDAVGFGLAEKLDAIKKADHFEACFQIQENFYNGITSLQLLLKDMHPTYDAGSISS